MLEHLRREGVSEDIIREIERFRAEHPVRDDLADRIPSPSYRYYGKEVWEMAACAILAGENLLLVGPKATGKNILAQCLSAAFGRPEWDVSLYVGTDAGSLIGADTFTGGEVRLREGPILRSARAGGFCVLDEINMAKNESLAALHAALDFRRAIDVPGYEKTDLSPATRFIGTMNYGYAGTREINEALASRFMVIRMPVISRENLVRLIRDRDPDIREEYAKEFALLFHDIRIKCDSGEISTKALDLRGLLAAIGLIRQGLSVQYALELALINKCFDDYERTLVLDLLKVRIPEGIGKEEIFM